MSPLDLQIELDRLMPVLSHAEQVCALWRHLDKRVRMVSKCEQLDSRALVVIATEHMKTLTEQGALEDWLDKHRDAIEERTIDRAIALVKSEELKFATKALVVVWLANPMRTRSRDLTPYFNEFEINSSNLSTALKDLVADGSREELAPEKGTEREFALTDSGINQLKRLMNDPPK